MTTKKSAKGNPRKRLTVAKDTLKDLAVAGRKAKGIKGGMLNPPFSTKCKI